MHNAGLIATDKDFDHLNPLYALRIRYEVKNANKSRCSTVILTRRHSHHYGEPAWRQTGSKLLDVPDFAGILDRNRISNA